MENDIAKKSALEPLPASLLVGLVSCGVVLGGMYGIAGYEETDGVRPLVLPLLGVVVAAGITGAGVARTGRRFPWVHLSVAVAVVVLMTALGMRAVNVTPPEQAPRSVVVDMA
jgi:hypothetical protein